MNDVLWPSPVLTWGRNVGPGDAGGVNPVFSVRCDGNEKRFLHSGVPKRYKYQLQQKKPIQKAAVHSQTQAKPSFSKLQIKMEKLSRSR